jgi:hypothetical protein
MKKLLLMVGLLMSSSPALSWMLDGVEMLEETYSCSANSTCEIREESGCASVKEKKKDKMSNGVVRVWADVKDTYTYPGQSVRVESEHELEVESYSEHRPLPISFKMEVESFDTRTNTGRSCVLPDQSNFKTSASFAIYPQPQAPGTYPIVATTTVQGAVNMSIKKTAKLYVPARP